MTTKNLVINFECGSFTVNEVGIKKLSSFIAHFLPDLNAEIDKFNVNPDSFDDVDKSYIPYLVKEVCPFVRLLNSMLD